MLSDRDILTALLKGELEISPLSRDDVQPASVDVHLADELLSFDSCGLQYIDPEKQPGEQMRRMSDVLSLPAGAFILGSTVERFKLGESILGRVEGKSSLGRLGLAVHITAGFIDPGFEGNITLEIVNHSPLPIILRPGMAIAQIAFSRLSSPVLRPYGSGRGSKYQGQTGVTASR